MNSSQLVHKMGFVKTGVVGTVVAFDLARRYGGRIKIEMSILGSMYLHTSTACQHVTC